MTQSMENKFLSTQELGVLLGVTRQTIRNWIKKGEITAFHIGQNLKIPDQEALRILRHYGLPFPEWLNRGDSTAPLPSPEEQGYRRYDPAHPTRETLSPGTDWT